MSVASQLKAYNLPRVALIIFVVLSVCIMSGGYLYYDNEKREAKTQVRKELVAIASLKVQEIDDWRKERDADARALASNPLFVRYAKQFLSGSPSSDVNNTVYSWLKSLQSSYGYSNVLLLDARKRVRLAVQEESRSAETFETAMVDEAMRKGSVTFADFHKDRNDRFASLDVILPILVQSGNEMHPIGLILLRVNPYLRLYPLLQTWPVPSSTSEALLVRREKNDVVYLNELRHKKNTALTLRFPISEEKLPAAMAVRGQEGVVEGKDYRGVNVLAAISAIPDSPWFLVTKVDIDEVYAPVRERLWTIISSVFALIILAGTIIGYSWRKHQADIYQTVNEALKAEIKERQQAEKLLDERTRMLEFTNKELETFSYSVSHDLRSPLRAIAGYAAMILKQQGDKFDEDTKRKFTLIGKNIQMMGRLIDDLLSFARLGHKEISTAHIDMEDLIRESWKELQIINGDRNIVFTMNTMPPCRGDRMLIRQVYSNLIANAVKFTQKVNDAHIEAGGYVEGDETIYYVKDNGAGFDMNYYNKLFGVFQRLHSDDYEGTGIGLSIVQRIIHKHGGRVWAEGKVNEGACFYFALQRENMK